MPRLDTLPDAIAAENLYHNLVIVYVEGDSDVQILSRLFPDFVGQQIEFKTPATGVAAEDAPGGGCEAVIKRVIWERPAVPVWGLVDRDIFRSRRWWSRCYATDNRTFKDHGAFGSEQSIPAWVEPLLLWEIENYLVHPEVLELLCRDMGKHAGSDPRDTDWVATQIIRLCRQLLPIAAGNSYLHDHGRPALPTHFALDCDAPSVEKKVRAYVAEAVAGVKVREPERDFDWHYRHVLELAGAEGESWRQALAAALRIVEGKMLIERIRKDFGVRECPRFLLARQIG